MRKFLALVFMLFALSCASSGKKDTAVTKDEGQPVDTKGFDLFANESPGQYVIYHDRRGSNNALCGFMKFNDTEYIARKYDINSGDEVIFQFKAIKRDNGELDVVPVSFFKGDEFGTLSLLTDMCNMITQYGEYVEHNLEEETITDKWPEFGYTLNHSYRSWIPFFHLYKSEKVEDRKSSFNLLYVGRMKSDKDLLFFKIKEILKAETIGEHKIERVKGNSILKLGLFEITLDGNWEKVEDRDFYRSYWIKKFSTRDAQAGIEKIAAGAEMKDLKKIVEKVICFSTLVVPSSVKIEKRKSCIKASYVVLDPENSNETYACSYFSVDKEGNINALHFSSFADIYKFNKKYFDSVLNGVDVKEE